VWGGERGGVGRGCAAWSITDQSPPVPHTPPHASDATPLNVATDGHRLTRQYPTRFHTIKHNDW